MITRWEIITRKTGLDEEDFVKHWRRMHAPLLEGMGLRRYVQNLVTDKEQRGVAFPRCDEDMDGLDELWWDNLHDMNIGLENRYQAVAADYPAFTGSVKSLITVKNQVIPIRKGQPIKRVSFIKRKEGMSFEEYKHEWWDVHGDLVRKFKGVRGYCQSLVLDRIIGGQSVSYEDIPIDGIVELYFDDVAGLEADFASEAGQKAQAHARTFLDKISTCIVERHDVWP
jgi:uncharacterized protein (TIGR02118 family)